ncbi:pilus assembly PilX family protein [Shewanella aestuarii]|uniref:Pilus assembly protein PilX n=1 Tax=Shewanella aestuarii TaxID=1028752 RepID=A0A6G9QLD6_9GAMM|nr:PilX N-terminal domain-containing pilus assembly protein [Shewanella aestuarii]QIR15198.1 pilus assembly protein PilX [Shewanella aestuarii]
MNIKLKHQQGIVLFFSLIVLVMMTVIGVALAVSSTQSLRMSGAGSERVEAMAAAHGALENAIKNSSGAGFVTMDMDNGMTITDATLGVKSSVKALTKADVNCQRSADASSGDLIKCIRIQIESTAEFGRDNLGSLTTVNGVEQEVLNIK